MARHSPPVDKALRAEQAADTCERTDDEAAAMARSCLKAPESRGKMNDFAASQRDVDMVAHGRALSAQGFNRDSRAGIASAALPGSRGGGLGQKRAAARFDRFGPHERRVLAWFEYGLEVVVPAAGGGAAHLREGGRVASWMEDEGRALSLRGERTLARLAAGDAGPALAGAVAAGALGLEDVRRAQRWLPGLFAQHARLAHCERQALIQVLLAVVAAAGGWRGRSWRSPAPRRPGVGGLRRRRGRGRRRRGAHVRGPLLLHLLPRRAEPLPAQVPRSARLRRVRRLLEDTRPRLVSILQAALATDPIEAEQLARPGRHGGLEWPTVSSRQLGNMQPEPLGQHAVASAGARRRRSVRDRAAETRGMEHAARARPDEGQLARRSRRAASRSGGQRGRHAAGFGRLRRKPHDPRDRAGAHHRSRSSYGPSRRWRLPARTSALQLDCSTTPLLE
ncbi:unnamed protein product [Prorocentrum cordatum]|uniref:Uncharacterized protein n=1 Tax=Prorocentrum cordatum TaxID=2364126 RepID=A0ABN9WLR1_9DINO|nr:unnamed protein product [Polarella glacialis]